MSKAIFSLIFMFVVSTKVYCARAEDSQALFAKYKEAVFKIIIKQQGLPDTFGTGFFISETGEAITNFHVMKDAVEMAGYTAEFKMFGGRVVHDFSVAQCSDPRDIDLCVIKLPVKPTAFFKWSLQKPQTGQKIFVIGHPQGLDFSMSDGIVSGLRLNEKKIELVQITAPISQGNSGGPVFTGDGSVVGIATSFMDHGQNLNLGVSSIEGKAFQMSQRKFQTASLYKESVIVESKKLSDALKKTLVEPAKQLLKEKESLDSLTNFSGRLLRLPGMRFAFSAYLPTRIGECIEQEDKIMCVDARKKGIFAFNRIPIRMKQSMLKVKGTILEKSAPLNIVQRFQKTGEWAAFEKNIAVTDRPKYYSNPQKVNCYTMPLTFAHDEDLVCETLILNDGSVGQNRLSTMFMMENYLYVVSILVLDPSMNSFFHEIPKLVLSSMKKLSPAQLQKAAGDLDTEERKPSGLVH